MKRLRKKIFNLSVDAPTNPNPYRLVQPETLEEIIHEGAVDELTEELTLEDLLSAQGHNIFLAKQTELVNEMKAHASLKMLSDSEQYEYVRSMIIDEIEAELSERKLDHNKVLSRQGRQIIQKESKKIRKNLMSIIKKGGASHFIKSKINFVIYELNYIGSSADQNFILAGIPDNPLVDDVALNGYSKEGNFMHTQIGDKEIPIGIPISRRKRINVERLARNATKITHELEAAMADAQRGRKKTWVIRPTEGEIAEVLHKYTADAPKPWRD